MRTHRFGRKIKPVAEYPKVSWPGQSNRHHVMRVAAQAARKKAYPDTKEGPAEAGPVGRLGSPAPEMEHAAVLI